jgi:hypothetical protein
MKSSPFAIVKRVGLPVSAVVLWSGWVARTGWILLNYSRRVPRADVWLYDWNVYHAAGGQLLDRTLYRAPLVQPGHELPIAAFNYPPLASAWAVPLLPLGRETGGVVWLIVAVMATTIGAVLGARALGLRWSWAWVAGGLGLAFYATSPYIAADVVLGNNNHLMLALVAGFALAHLSGHQRLAGLLLALAIGTKLWPVALLVLVLRERRWRELRWTVGALAMQGALTLALLGPDVVGAMLAAVLGQNLARGAMRDAPVLWISALHVWWRWWPVWGGYAIAGALILVPLTGRLGLGLGIIAGLSLNANLWHHYAPVFVLGLLFIAFGLSVATPAGPARCAWPNSGEPLRSFEAEPPNPVQPAADHLTRDRAEEGRSLVARLLATLVWCMG